MESFSWQPVYADYKQILEMIKSKDEMLIYEGVTHLQNQLAVAQENTLTSFQIDLYIPALIEILKMPLNSDMSGEIQMFTIQCLTNLMDIFPSICNSIITNGGVKCITQTLERSMGYIDLNEACIKNLEKVSNENPYAVLTSGAIGICLNMMDFFDQTTQKRIINLVLNVSRHSASEQDLTEYVMPIAPVLCQLLQSRDQDKSRLEIVSTVIYRIQESVLRFYPSHSSFPQIKALYENMGQTGILESILQCLQEYSIYDLSAKMQESSPVKESSGSSQTTINTSANKVMTNLTIQNFLKILTLCCRFSQNLAQVILNYNTLNLLETFIPSQEDDQRMNRSSEDNALVQETLNFLYHLFPESQESAQNEIDKPRIETELAKNEMFKNQDAGRVTHIAEKLLPRVFNVYGSNINSEVRAKALQIIDKMISLFNSELLNNFIEPYSFAKFIYSSLRTKHLSSVLLCLRMIEKLMNSNPRAYSLPLMREGVVPYIQNLSSIENIEKHLGFKISIEQPLGKEEAFIEQIKKDILRGGPPTDQKQQINYEFTLQKYLEVHRLSQDKMQLDTSGQTNKSQLDLSKQLAALSNTLLDKFFQNQEFLAQIEEWSGEETKILNRLKDLADKIKEEAVLDSFHFERSKGLLKALADNLTNNRRIMSYEFKESGILEALELYLTRSPTQAKFYLEKQKNENKGEEMKHSEQIEMSGLIKDSQIIRKREARAFIQRLRLFSLIIISQVNDKRPFNELLNLCHEMLSQGENQIFQGQNLQQDMLQHPGGYGGMFGSSNPFSEQHQSIAVLKQLTRRTRVNLVFDQQKTFLNKEQVLPGSDSSEVEEKQMMMKPSLQRGSSHHPAFQHLTDKFGADEGVKDYSKVFIKRHFLYSELKQVLISVEQCASLTMLEDFLKNKIRSEEDVKNLKAPPSYLGSSRAGYSSRLARHLLDRSLDRMREILEAPRDQAQEQSEYFQQKVADEIIGARELTEEEKEGIIIQLETSQIHLIDEFCANEENQFDDGMSDGQEIEQRIAELQRAIDGLKQNYKAKKEILKHANAAKQQLKLEKAKERRESEMIVDESEEERQKEAQKVKARGEDVEMTDEEGEEAKRQKEILEQKFKMAAAQQRKEVAQREVQLTIEEDMDEDGNRIADNKEILNTDLESLLKSNGEDIEFEFYFNGKQVLQSQTLIEITKDGSSNQDQNKKVPNAYSYYGGGHSDTYTIYFAIKDKINDIMPQRKDSIMEFTQKRERAKSEAVEEMSLSSVNSIVHQIIEKEFQVFSNDLSAEMDQIVEKKQLHQSLKILKVLNYVYKNQQILSSQGIRFLMNSQHEEEHKEEGLTDFDMQVGLSQINLSVFLHHKLDSFILQSMNDPYKISDILQQIFKNCSFLFSFHVRSLFFRMGSFMGSIDMNRYLYFLKKFLKQKHGPDDKIGGIKIQRQKEAIDRTMLLDSTFKIIKNINKKAFLEIQFKDEVGTGQGPTLEFYSLIAEEMKNPQNGIWRQSLSDNSLFPAPIAVVTASQETLQKSYDLFRLTGVMMAKSISDDRLIDLPLSSVFWDLILGKKMNLFDLDRLDKGQFDMLSELQIIANKKREIDKQHFVDMETKTRQINSLRTSRGTTVEDLCLTFVMPGYDHIELKMGGKDIVVTLDNLQDYIDLFMHFTFHESIKIQLQAFRKGFNMIFPVESLKPFTTTSELEDMICGCQRNEDDWKIQKLKENIFPAHGYHSKSTQYNDFLMFMSELTPQERRCFLKFITGSPRLPNGGFASLDPKMTVVHKKPLNAKDSPDNILPSVMTCQNFVKLPSYSSYEVMKAQFQTAWSDGSGSFDFN